ncbi:hypothetical protein QBC37DRAFT_485471 [Rhypophila decipiens]|uniref:Clr5 domain-containing protein n=1 Tax=Rhypophila decipiens TaxID=261697 RepID=A0AAN7B2G8_9PEZI|nr:hypothetical protein QBC37DRAFT_485471 [Rhypophila decipiens]
MSRNSNSIWQQHRHLFHRLYLEDDNQLKDVKVIAERDHNFPRTPLSTYEAKLRDELKLRKNLKPEDWAFIGRDLKSRRGRYAVLLCGVRISDDKVRRYVTRYRNRTIRESPSHPPRGELRLLPTRSRSPAPRNLVKHPNILVNQIFSLLRSDHNMPHFVQFSSPILDRRFADLWAPLMDELPIIMLQTILRAHYNHATYSAFAQDANPGAGWGADSLRSVEDIEYMVHMDAVNLGLLPHFSSNNGLLSSHPGAAHYECQLSTFRNPFHALTIILHHLSNKPTLVSSTLMDETFRQIPTPLLALLLSIDCPTVRATRRQILNWTIINDDQELFHVLAEIWLKNKTASFHPETPSKLLCLAAWFGITDLCTTLIQNGASLTLEHVFYARQGPKLHIIHNLYSPLAAAAVRGSVEVVKLILGTGVNSYTTKSAEYAVEHVIRRVKESNQDRERLLHILSLLLAAGTDVYTLSKGFDPVAVRTGHHLNLLDVAWLSGDTEVIELFLPYKMSESCMTVSGTIMAAMDGSKALSHYLASAPDPIDEHERLSIQNHALSSSLTKMDVKSCSIMMKAKFGRDPSFVWHFHDFENKSSLTSEPRSAIIIKFVEHVFQDSPSTAESEEIATLILSDPLWTIFRRYLIHACLKNLHQEMWQYILQHPIIRETIDMVVMMALAVRFNNLAVVDFLLQSPFNMSVNAEVHYCNQRYSVLFLSAGSSCEDFPLTWVMSGSLPASPSVLEDLVRRGADISTCHPRYWSQQHWVAGKQLLWLLEKGLLAHGLTSVYGLLLPRMQTKSPMKNNPKTRIQTDENRLEDRNILEWLCERDVPLISAAEASSLRCSGSVGTSQHPLSYFISLQPQSEVLDRVFGVHIDINARGGDPLSDTPLRAAIRVADCATVERLVSMGVETKITRYDSEYPFTALQLACHTIQVYPEWRHLYPGGNYSRDFLLPHTRIVKTLLKTGVDPNRRGTLCCISTLQVTAGAKIMKLLLEYGADPNEVVSPCSRCEHSHHFRWLRLPSGGTLLHVIVVKASMVRPSINDILQVLLKGGAKPTRDVLALACKTGNLDLVKLLLDWNANVNPSNPAARPALSAAASKGNLPIILLLLAAGAVVEPEIDNILESPLVAAAQGGALDVVFLLMQLETREHVIACAMEGAYSKGHLEVSSQLKQLLYRRRSGSAGVAQTMSKPGAPSCEATYKNSGETSLHLGSSLSLSREQRR